MGFRENLKNELSYSGMLVKELAAKTGINKYTIDNYLSAHNCTPSVSAAVKIAGVLGVSVEYLVTGHEVYRKIGFGSLEFRTLVEAMEPLAESDRKIVLKNALNLIEALKERV